LAKGPALAGPSERSERFEPLVRPGLRCTVVRATQSEKADTTELKLLRGKFNVLLSAIVLPCVYSGLWIFSATRCCGWSFTQKQKVPEVPNVWLRGGL